jgi:hypothetical protein
MSDYILTCPKCKSKFDVSIEMEKWKGDLLSASKILEQIKEILVKGIKNE